MKGIILVAGNGTRLAPTTLSVSKPLLPVYDKPMIYYPLATLIDAGIKDILIITNEKDKQKFVNLLGDGRSLGLNLNYEVQYVQRGIADAFIVGKDFIGDDNVCLILGDNLYCGQSIQKQTIASSKLKEGAEIYGYHVPDPRRFGVAVFDENKNVTAVEEKPENPKSDLAVTGLYFFDNTVVEIAANLKPSKRGELEIPDVINEYIKRGQCKLNEMGSDVKWMDVGTFSSLLEASNYVAEIQKRTNKLVGCIEESVFKQGYIDFEDIIALSERQKKSEYGAYLKNIADTEVNNILNHYRKMASNREIEQNILDIEENKSAKY